MISHPKTKFHGQEVRDETIIRRPTHQGCLIHTKELEKHAPVRDIEVDAFALVDLALAIPASGEEMATALDRWDEEGGAQNVAWPLPYEASDLRDVERRVLECLGAALVSEWNDLPTDVQRRLFEHAASGKSHDAAVLKTQIARFLHDHKGASGGR
jgi:hypothetical protein